MRRLFGWIGLAFMLASTLLLGASRLLPQMDAARWADAAEATGQIVGFARSGPGQRPLICFVAENGDPYVFEADATNAAMRQGQLVTVRYYLEPDLRASLKMDFSQVMLGLGIAGSTLMALGLASLLIQMRKSSLRRQLMQYGIQINATVDSINMNRHVTVNGRHPYTVTCTLRNPQGIGEWTVKSGWVWKTPPGLQTGGTVPVLVDVHRPGLYCVLVEEAAVSPATSEAL